MEPRVSRHTRAYSSGHLRRVDRGQTTGSLSTEPQKPEFGVSSFGEGVGASGRVLTLH